MCAPRKTNLHEGLIKNKMQNQKLEKAKGLKKLTIYNKLQIDICGKLKDSNSLNIIQFTKIKSRTGMLNYFVNLKNNKTRISYFIENYLLAGRSKHQRVQSKYKVEYRLVYGSTLSVGINTSKSERRTNTSENADNPEWVISNDYNCDMLTICVLVGQSGKILTKFQKLQKTLNEFSVLFSAGLTTHSKVINTCLIRCWVVNINLNSTQYITKPGKCIVSLKNLNE